MAWNKEEEGSSEAIVRGMGRMTSTTWEDKATSGGTASDEEDGVMAVARDLGIERSSDRHSGWRIVMQAEETMGDNDGRSGRGGGSTIVDGHSRSGVGHG